MKEPRLFVFYKEFPIQKMKKKTEKTKWKGLDRLMKRREHVHKLYSVVTH